MLLEKNALKRRKQDNQFYPKGESLSVPHRVYRVKVVRSFMKAGVPLNKIDCLSGVTRRGSIFE